MKQLFRPGNNALCLGPHRIAIEVGEADPTRLGRIVADAERLRTGTRAIVDQNIVISDAAIVGTEYGVNDFDKV